MASPHNQPIPVTSPLKLSLSTESHRHGRSKAQMCLFKILRIISFFPAVDVSYEQRSSHDDPTCENRRCDVDLNIGLGGPTEIEPFEYPLAAKGDADCRDCVYEKSDPRNSDLLFAEIPETFEEERVTEHSEISHVGDQSSGIDCNGASEVEGEKITDKGYLDLLIEAAELILGSECEPPSNKTDVESSTTAEKGGGTKRKQLGWTTTAAADWYPEFEDTSPVVKSYRGRNQVLPLKFRDSIVEPLVRWPSSRHRSNSDAAFPTKRRSK
ncbi:hypothetical protein L1887_19035 [Cichorium endivia]|nr:hypothetical protein L1887_19035 [Cichorium endivia]